MSENFNYKSLLKYPGGKEAELKIIKEYLPDKFNKYYEPFVGGGAVFFDANANKYLINDKSNDLINLYSCIKNNDDNFYKYLQAIDYNWKLLHTISIDNNDFFMSLFNDYRNKKINDLKLSDKISEFIVHKADDFNGMLSIDFNYYIDNFITEVKKNLLSKVQRVKKLEDNNETTISDEDISNIIEGALKSAFYTHFRMLFNKRDIINSTTGFNTAVYLFIREMCYSSMYRYNGKGEFNVPYGGISYNNKEFLNRIAFYKSIDIQNKLQNTTIENMDFYDFVKKYPLDKNDFMFIDPPYDSEFSSYDNIEFNLVDQERLANYLINECKGMFMVVIKRTLQIESLYPEGVRCANNNKLNVRVFDKKYTVSFMNRNNKEAKHMLITNY